MRCPFCNFDDTKVINSRGMDDNRVIRRRRSCEKCDARFTTFEKIELIEFMVVKRDGSREIYDKNKLINGIILSCNKRPVTIAQIEKISDEFEQILQNNNKREVSSDDIGEFVMLKLRDIDEVSYVRFASVYRKFKDINTFKEELDKLVEEKDK